jgi:AraC-like DNA-binding protein
MPEGMGDRILVQTAEKTRSLDFGGGPMINSATTDWAGPALEQHRLTTFEASGEVGPIDGQHGLLVIVEGEIEVALREGGREVRYLARPGGTSFLSSRHRPHLLRMRGNAQAVALQLSSSWFQRLLLDDAPPDLGRATPFVPDPTLLALTCAMRDEVARGAVTGRLYAESLSVALLSYALDQVPFVSAVARGCLSDTEQRRLRRYILDHLAEDLSLSDLAALVGRQPRRFSTLFRQAFGATPHRYLINARLAEGARRLARGADVAEVALDVGFCSQSHFTEAFRRAYGMTPHRYATQKRKTV